MYNVMQDDKKLLYHKIFIQYNSCSPSFWLLPCFSCLFNTKMEVNFPERHWKRSIDVTSFPKVWHRFHAEDKQGKTHEILIQDMMPEQREEVWDMFREHSYRDEELHK